MKHIYKAIALSNFNDKPFVKAILMDRAPLTAIMKASYFIELAEKQQLPKNSLKDMEITLKNSFYMHIL